MAHFQGPSPSPSSESNSSEMDKLMERVSNEQSNSEGESFGTEQSFRTAHAVEPPTPRKSRFIEHFGSVKLTERNLAASQAGYKRLPRPASHTDSHFHPKPSPGATTSRIKRKPLPDSAREALQEKKDEEEVEALEKRANKSGLGQDPTFPDPTPVHEPSFHRSNTTFTDFVPYHQVLTWQQVDNEAYQQRRAHSLTAIALDGMKKLSPNRNSIAAQSRKAATQLREVLQRTRTPS